MSELAAVGSVKERLCYAALDYPSEVTRAEWARTPWTLPHGSERCTFPELLFNPALNGFEFPGIVERLFESITKCNEIFKSKLWENIVTTGGSTLFEGLAERINREIAALAQVKTKVLALPNREIGACVGGSILATASCFPSMVVTHEEYNESGPGIIHRKCF
jgi:actin